MPRVTKQEMSDFRYFVRKWALKRMRKLEKKLFYFAQIYFGENVRMITYETKNKTLYVLSDGESLELNKVAKEKEEPCD